MIRVVPETGSTSTDLANRLAGGNAVPEGEWLVADRQNSGRGRHGRGWLDGAGNFMGSTVVHRGAGDPPVQSLALASALAVHDALRGYLPGDRPVVLKWPNDLLIGSAKVAGILLEGAGRPGGQSAIVGIGVNLVSAPDLPDRACASLADFGAAPSRDAFARSLAESFAAELDRWRRFGLSPLIARWQALAHPVGTRLGVTGPKGARIIGTFAGLADDGALRLRLDDGETRVIQAGEVLIEDAR